MHIRHCMFDDFRLGNNASVTAPHICAALGESTVAVALVEIGLKDFVPVTHHWKIVRGLDILFNLTLNEQRS